jgi:hypothetical protein
MGGKTQKKVTVQIPPFLYEKWENDSVFFRRRFFGLSMRGQKIGA